MGVAIDKMGLFPANTLLRIIVLGAFLAWTLIIGTVYFWDIERGRQFVEELAISQARAHYNKDVAFRLWGTSHGRIYVPQTARTRPDPNLSHIPERDIETPAGQQLTLINPAAIIRELNDRFGRLYGVAGRITSTNPLRKENEPDPWERRALELFKAGEKEVIEFTQLNGEPYLRLMQPLMVVPGCLLCHGHQGYQVGKVAGGVGVSLPLRELWTHEYARQRADGISLLLIWLLGCVLLGFFFWRLHHAGQKWTETMGRLIKSEARKSAVMASALDCIITMDHQGRIIEFNPAAERTFGYQQSEAIGRSLAKLLIPPSLRGLHRDGLRRYLAGEGRSIIDTRIETTAMRADGSEFPVELAVTRIEADGHPIFTAYLRDLSEARRLQERISFQSTHDDLTGLINRAEFERRLRLLLDNLGVVGERHAVLYLDLDQFKVVNDIGGHQAGDELLRQVARLLYATMKAGDTLARLGGDEFGLILEDCSEDDAERMSGKLLQAVQEFRFAWKGQSFNITTSIGVVPLQHREQSLSDVLIAADTACYMAKEQGRNRIHLFQHNDVEFARRQGEMQWVNRIHDAFKDGRFFLYYQPLHPLQTGVDAGWHYEILIRMQDESGEFVSPGLFLSAAERYSLVSTIDRWVVRTTFAWLKNNPQHLQRLEMCSINLSGHSVTDDTFLEFLVDQLRRNEVPAERICFEITETAAVSNLSKAERFIEILRTHGCRFALDDFGSGMSSFAYLKNLPVDFLKIDGAFVRDIMDDEIDFAMVRSINEIGHVMGKKTIAEFVENEAIMLRLKEIGVDYAQGYGIARPASLEQMSDHSASKVSQTS